MKMQVSFDKFIQFANFLVFNQFPVFIIWRDNADFSSDGCSNNLATALYRSGGSSVERLGAWRPCRI
jgi:hypothetical protein